MKVTRFALNFSPWLGQLPFSCLWSPFAEVKCLLPSVLWCLKDPVPKWRQQAEASPGFKYKTGKLLPGALLSIAT